MRTGSNGAAYGDPRIRTCFEDGAKRLGGGEQGMALLEDAPVPLELRLPVSLFALPRRVELRLRTLDPIHSLGHGNGVGG